MNGDVIDFKTKKILKDTEEAVDQIVEFRNFYEGCFGPVSLIAEAVLHDLAAEFKITGITVQDYILLRESIMGILFRNFGKHHPLIHEIADKFFTEEEPTKPK
jgi:hypothetical protein